MVTAPRLNMYTTNLTESRKYGILKPTVPRSLPMSTHTTPMEICINSSTRSAIVPISTSMIRRDDC